MSVVCPKSQRLWGDVAGNSRLGVDGICCKRRPTRRGARASMEREVRERFDPAETRSTREALALR